LLDIGPSRMSSLGWQRVLRAPIYRHVRGAHPAMLNR
jgi:hypothetical protein